MKIGLDAQLWPSSAVWLSRRFKLEAKFGHAGAQNWTQSDPCESAVAAFVVVVYLRPSGQTEFGTADERFTAAVYGVLVDWGGIRGS